MTWDLSKNHIDFRDVCKSFVDRQVRPVIDEAERAGRPPDGLLEKMGTAGLLGLIMPEEFGGTGGDSLSVAILAEQLSRGAGGIAITALVSAYMAGPHISRYGNEQQRKRWLPGVCAGTSIVAVAITEPGTGSDVAGITTTAKHSDGGYTINGHKMFITNAGISDIIVVAAKTDPSAGRKSGITTFLVEPDTAGLSMGNPLRKLGWHSSDTRELVFDNCWVPDEAVLGEVGRGFYQIMGAFELERVGLAAMGLGHAAECLDQAIAYTKVRDAFGVPLIKMQSVRHKLAEMTAELEAARVLTYQSAARIDTGHPDAARSAAVAKYWVARAANKIVDDALQLFGGAGFLEETPVARHYRDARVLRIGGGTDEIQLEILGKDFDS